MLDRVTGSDRSRFYLACAIGGALALIVFAWFILGGRADLLRPEFLSNFYDAQARSLLHGHWNVSKDPLWFERFKIGNKFYEYFGPWPAVLRMPVIAFTRRLDGRLSRISMLLAFTVLLVGVARLSWRARTLVEGDTELSRAALIGAGAFVFVGGCGSTALFLASRSWAYQEAILWAAAWSVAAFVYLLAYLLEPSRRNLVLASLTATLAFLSRATVGSGPVLALGIVLLAQAGVRARDRWRRRGGDREAPEPAAPSWLRWLGLDTDAMRRPLGPLAVATAIPVALYAYVNDVKFGSLFGLPLKAQDLVAASPPTQAAMAANHGTILGLKYVPTNLLQYFRPDAIGFDRLFPWVTFSGAPRVIGGAVFVDIAPSASIPATATLLFVLAVLGVIAVLRARRPTGDGPTAAVLRVPLVAAAIGGATVLAIAYLQNRYEGDFLPMLLIAAAAGLWWLPRLLARSGPAVHAVVHGGLVVLGVWSCWATGALTFSHQRAYSPLVTQPTLTRYVDLQLAVQQTVPGGAPSRVGHGSGLPLPPAASAGSLFELGNCAGLYWSNGQNWEPVEETARTGQYRLAVRFAAAPPGTLEPLLSATDSRGTGIVWARARASNRVGFEYEWIGSPRGTRVGGGSLAVRPGRTVDLSVRLDPVVGFFEVDHDGTVVTSSFAPVAQRPAVVGSQDASTRGATRFAGTVRSLATPTPVCDRLRRLER